MDELFCRLVVAFALLQDGGRVEKVELFHEVMLHADAETGLLVALQEGEHFLQLHGHWRLAGRKALLWETEERGS